MSVCFRTIPLAYTYLHRELQNISDSDCFLSHCRRFQAYKQLFHMTQEKALQLTEQGKEDGGGTWTARDVERAVFVFKNDTSGFSEGPRACKITSAKNTITSPDTQKRARDVPAENENHGDETENISTSEAALEAVPTAPRRSKRLKPRQSR